MLFGSQEKPRVHILAFKFACFKSYRDHGKRAVNGRKNSQAPWTYDLDIKLMPHVSAKKAYAIRGHGIEKTAPFALRML